MKTKLSSGRCQITFQAWLCQNVKQEREDGGNVASIGPKAPFTLNMEKNRGKIFFFNYFLHGSYLIQYILNDSL